MKTAVSIPDGVYADADRAAARLGWSRSQLYTRALRSYLAEHLEDDPVTAALDRLSDDLDSPAIRNVGRELIDSGSWEW